MICRELALCDLQRAGTTFRWSRQLLRAAGCQGQKNNPSEDAADYFAYSGGDGDQLLGQL